MVKRVISKLVSTIYRLLFILIGKLPAKDIIMFESFLGKQFSDNPRAIYEYMLDKYPQYIMYWSADKRYLESFTHENIRCVKRLSLRWVVLMARSKYWITNSRLPLWIKKPKHTSYIQTWHGTPLKKLAADMKQVHMPGTDTEQYKFNFINEAKKWDYLISPNAYSSRIFKRAFQYKKRIIESGYPRNDFLLNNNENDKIKLLKKRLNLPMDKKILLYAPTWRDNLFYEKGRYRFNIPLDLKQMQSQLGEGYIVLLRLHYLVAENLDISDFKGFVYDFSLHHDIRELYLVSDILITDYSSVFFDYANLKRPMLFYVYDIEEYRDNLRGFYMDFETEAPGPLIKTTEHLINEIKNIEVTGYHESDKLKYFYDTFCYLEDGFASERVVKEIFN